jgi:DNA replication protein
MFNRSRKGEKLLHPERLSKDLGIPVEQVGPILEDLMRQDLLRIEMVVGQNGKESETYNMNNVVTRILAEYEKQFALGEAGPKTYATAEAEIVDMLETGFQKQLTAIEVEILKKWVAEDGFTLLDIRRAVLDAVKANKHTLSYVDSLLIKRRAQAKKEGAVKYDAGQPEALKTFFDSWPKK